MPFDQQNFEPTPTDPVLCRLIAGRDRIANPAHWTKGALSRGWAGDGPISMCARGAIFCDFSDVDVWRAADALLTLHLPDYFRLMGKNHGIPNFNNHPDTTHADVLALFDRAIAARRAELLMGDEIGAVASETSA